MLAYPGGTSNGKEAAEQVRQIFDVNLNGVLNTVLPALDRMMARQSGQIAIMSSLAGFLPLPGAPAYGASKAAVRQYGEALRMSARSSNVQVSVICPGFVHSRMTAANPFTMPLIMPPDKAARIIAKGLAKNRTRIAFPWPIYAAVWLLGSVFPAALNQRILERLPEKPPSDATASGLALFFPLALHLAPFRDVSVMFSQSLGKGVPARTVRDEIELVGLQWIEGRCECCPPRVANWARRQALNPIGVIAPHPDLCA